MTKTCKKCPYCKTGNLRMTYISQGKNKSMKTLKKLQCDKCGK